MHVMVPIRQILDPSGITVRADKELIFVNVEEYIIAPGDKIALEAALQIKDTNTAQVSAVCIGPDRADDALREALAMGADAAYLLRDELFADVDAAGVARIMAAAAHRISPDLIVTSWGDEDPGAAQLGPRLAELLDMAQITAAYQLAPRDGFVTALRRWQEAHARLEAPLPAVVAVAGDACAPRYPHGARIMSAYRQWQVQVWDAADLGLGPADLAPLVHQRSQGFPPVPEVGERLLGHPQDVARELAGVLRIQRLV